MNSSMAAPIMTFCDELWLKDFTAADVLPHESSYTHNLDIASSHEPSLPQTWKY